MVERAINAVLSRAAPAPLGFDGGDHRLDFQPFAGVAKIQLIDGEAQAKTASILGIPLPRACQEVEAGPISCAWLAPREWLLTGSSDDVADAVARLRCAIGDSGLVTDLAHGRTAFLLTGPGARDALAAHCPLDLSDAALPVGHATRSLLGDAALFLSRKTDEDGAPAFMLIVDQTMANYAVRMLAGIGASASAKV